MADDLYEARNSIYCYPGSDVLINKLNIKDNQLLSEAERKIVLTKSYELRKNSKIGDFDLNHFLEIHKFLFEDIYPFAGKFRNENIAKGYFSFAEWQYIEPEIKRLFDKLKAENYLQGKSREELVKGLAYYLSELNVLHPFREGNGRTIREFIRELAFFNGYVLDLQNTTSEELLKASVDSIADTKELEETLNRCLIKTDF
jgi:cell filamentation protein